MRPVVNPSTTIRPQKLQRTQTCVEDAPPRYIDNNINARPPQLLP